VLHLETGQITGWTEDYIKVDGMHPYSLFSLNSPAKKTTLVSANKGIGKSKEGNDWRERLLQRFLCATFLMVAANVTLARKHAEDTRRRRGHAVPRCAWKD
jgi:hypothetical protein